MTTSGSSAGVGFAVPSDQVSPVVDQMIRLDLRQQGRVQARLGVSIIVKPSPSRIVAGEEEEASAAAKTNATSLLTSKCWVTAVKPDSPADRAGVRPLRIIENDASVEYGDAIVASKYTNQTEQESFGSSYNNSLLFYSKRLSSWR